MSCFLMINSWAGSDQEMATEKMARVFRMGQDEASPIVDNLANGNPWQFDHQVSDRQSEMAEPYLRNLGFDVERIPVIDDDGMGMPMQGSSAGKTGFFAKIKNLFKKKR